jgi:hypothetical protein
VVVKVSLACELPVAVVVASRYLWDIKGAGYCPS